MSSARASLKRLTIGNFPQCIFKPTRVHSVEAGDCLELIASTYGTTVESIKRLNKIEGDVIVEGSVLYIDKRIPIPTRRGKREIASRPIPRLRKANAQERNATMMEDLEAEAAANCHSLDSSTAAASGSGASALDLRSSRLGGTRRHHQGSRLRTVRVRFGDTLAGIAQANGLQAEELQRLNNLRDDSINEGDVLALGESGCSDDHAGEIRRGARRTYRPLFSRLSDGGGGDTANQQTGTGGPEVTQLPYRGVIRKSISHRRKSQASSECSKVKVGGRWKAGGTKTVRRSPSVSSLVFGPPVRPADGFVSSPFGWRWGAFHEGVDLAAAQGTPILAANRGVVTFAGWSGGYGYLLTIQHNGGFSTRYGHCCAIHSRVGQKVARGQQVAAVGSTGHSTGPHLHFEVRRNDEALDPLDWVGL
ncbi:hypothetical protein CBR_g23873 [Chara braunii]|uniref:LysM domain-containing protein n=1 Tax=Chara braunii TaxID=69332 RepID=A0A388L546_CHABU|nr:hypothetical protein CBR_g23873 [Chara braunii]|eukprot:GBG77424.1 hypothetical protein CBR_g23873 [Chara braunii]